jgi:molecular chaperone DnaK
MQQEAEMNAEADKKKMELAEVKNLADQMIHTAEKALKDAEGKISDEIKNEVTEKRINLTSIKNNPDSTKEQIEKATEELSQSMMKIGEAMKTANDQAGQNAATENPSQENTNNNETQS